MKIDPQLRTGVGVPTPRTPSKHRFRDIGNGKIECENTKRVMNVQDARGVPDGHTITLTDEEWTKLEELAAYRSTPKHTCTPEECLRGMIAACQPGGSGWKCPGS